MSIIAVISYKNIDAVHRIAKDRKLTFPEFSNAKQTTKAQRIRI